MSSRYLTELVRLEQYDELNQLLPSRNYTNTKITMRWTTPTDIVRLLIDHNIRIIFRSLQDYTGEWEQLVTITDNMKLLNRWIQLPLNDCHALRQYIKIARLEGRTAGLIEGDDCYVDLNDITELTTGHQHAFEYFYLRGMIQHLRVLLTVYTPPIELLDILIDESKSLSTLMIMLTLPIPWTDSQRYRIVFKARSYLNHQWIIYCDSAYRITLEAIYCHLDIVNYGQYRDWYYPRILRTTINDLNNGKTPKCVKVGRSDALYDYTIASRRSIANQYSLLIGHDYLSQEQRMDIFEWLVINDHQLTYCSDPRLIDYHKRLLSDLRDRQVNPAMILHPNVINYLQTIELMNIDHDYIKMLVNNDRDDDLSNSLIIQAVNQGIIPANILKADNPLNAMMRMRTTKSSGMAR